jgi:HD superfamily phosphohydrolase
LPVNWELKLVRCPLYGFVGLSGKENRLLDTVAMQRLSRIKQLAHTYIVFPSAVHTRLEHSLGTLCLAARTCDQLKLSRKQKQVIRIAALLHDVGQGPFSHLWEGPMRWINGEEYSHEDVTKLMIECEPEIGKALGGLRQDVLEVFTGDSLSSDIISGSLDVDKLDYLRRDSYHTGVAYGLFDIERVMRTLCKISDAGRDYLAIQEKGKDALESYRLGRYAMHIQVYEHHTRLVADDMFLKAIKLALSEGTLSEKDFKISNDPNEFIDNFLKLDDFSIQHQILQNSAGIAKKLIENVRNRRLLKRALEVPLTKEGVKNAISRKKIMEMDKKEIEKAENKIAKELGIDPADVIIHLQSIKIKLYERFEQTIGKKETPIYVKRKDGSFSSLEEESPISASLRQLSKLYVFCPKKYSQKTKRIAEDMFEVKSVS